MEEVLKSGLKYNAWLEYEVEDAVPRLVLHGHSDICLSVASRVNLIDMQPQKRSPLVTMNKKLLSLALTFILRAAINFMKQNVWQAFLDTFVFITFF